MISNKDLRVEDGNIIINGEKHPLDPAVNALTKRANIVQGKFSALDTRLDAIEALEKTASGNPISLTGAAEAYAMGLSMTIEPIQDLHGYTKPWPAGGGKNKCNTTITTEYCVAGGIVSDKIGEVTLTETTSLLLSFEQNIAIGSVQRNTLVLRDSNAVDHYPTNVTQPGLNAGYHEGLIENMPAGTYDVRVWIQIPDVAVSVTNFMVRDASIIDNTFEPYSNICPISGLTSGEVTTTDGTDTTTATITLGQTVYGGSVNFKTGEVTVTHGMLDMGTVTYYKFDVTQGTLFRCGVSDIKPIAETVVSDMLCSAYPTKSSLERTNISISQANNTANVDIVDSRYTNTADFKTAMSGVQLCYELATPTTLSLTPAELELLKGANTISGNGANISISYIGR